MWGQGNQRRGRGVNGMERKVHRENFRRGGGISYRLFSAAVYTIDYFLLLFTEASSCSISDFAWQNR